MTEAALNTDSELRKVEAHLEEIGRSICSIHGGIRTWNAINDALEDVAVAIQNCWRFEED